METIKISIKRNNKSMEREYSRATKFRSPVIMDTEEIFKLISPFSPSSSKSLSAEEWLASIEELKELYGWNNRLTLMYASWRLEDAAKRWFEESSYEWPEFKVKFIRRFSNRLSKRELFEELIHRRKEYNESFENYVFDMERTALKCGCSVEETINYIISGLRDSWLENELIAMNCRTVDALLSRLKKLTAGGENEDDVRIQLNRAEGRQSRERIVSNQKVCYKCGESGHFARECRGRAVEVEKPVYSDQPKKEFSCKRNVMCVSCKKLGHYASDCPSKDVVCRKCKGKGHKFFECKVRVDEEHVEDRREHRQILDEGAESHRHGHHRSDHHVKRVEPFCMDCDCNGHTTYDCRLRKKEDFRRERFNERNAEPFRPQIGEVVREERSTERSIHSRSEEFHRKDGYHGRNPVDFADARREEKEYERNFKDFKHSPRNEGFWKGERSPDNVSHPRRDEIQQDRAYDRNFEHFEHPRRVEIHREEREHFTHPQKDQGFWKREPSPFNSTHPRRDEIHREDRAYERSPRRDEGLWKVERNPDNFKHPRKDKLHRDEKDHEQNSIHFPFKRKHEDLREERDIERLPENFRREESHREGVMCFKCKKEGHFAKHCNFIPEISQMPICQICKRKGHTYEQCHKYIDEKLREERKRRRNDDQCSQVDEIKKSKTTNFKIERRMSTRFNDAERRIEENHEAETMIKNPETKFKFVRKDFKRSCYNCREYGHLVNACPLKMRQQNDHSIKTPSSSAAQRPGTAPDLRNSYSTSPKKSIDPGSSEKLKRSPNEPKVLPIKPNRSLSEYLKPARIDHVYVTALINLASECTTLQKSEFIKYDWKLQPCNLEVSGFGHSSAMTLGKITKNVCVGEVELMIDILIVDDSIQDFPLVLGSNFLDHPSVCVVKKYRSLDIKLVDEKSEKNPVASSNQEIDETKAQFKTEPDVENELLELLDMIKQDCASNS